MQKLVRFITVSAYAERFQVTRAWVYNAIKRGDLTAQGGLVAVEDGHQPPLRQPGNPKFKDPTYQQQLSSRRSAD